MFEWCIICNLNSWSKSSSYLTPDVCYNHQIKRKFCFYESQKYLVLSHLDRVCKLWIGWWIVTAGKLRRLWISQIHQVGLDQKLSFNICGTLGIIWYSHDIQGAKIKENCSLPPFFVLNCIHFPLPNFGNVFIIPFPFPNCGNGFFSFPSRSQIVGMDFFHSLPVPEFWE